MPHRSDLEPNEDDARFWGEAATLADVGVLMARWLEGDISYQPGYGAAGPDSESDGLVALLAGINRAGFVTTCSQPGEVDGDWVQRAAVEGFCSEATVERLTEAILETDLIALFWPPRAVGHCYQIPVSREGRRQNTWVGVPQDAENIERYYSGDLSPDGVSALLGAFQVTILDPRWGRNDLLWPTVSSAVEADASGGKAAEAAPAAAAGSDRNSHAEQGSTLDREATIQVVALTTLHASGDSDKYAELLAETARHGVLAERIIDMFVREGLTLLQMQADERGVSLTQVISEMGIEIARLDLPDEDEAPGSG